MKEIINKNTRYKISREKERRKKLLRLEKKLKSNILKRKLSLKNK